jgi:hypothetical protein
MDWSSFVCGSGFGAVAIIVLGALIHAAFTRGTPPTANGPDYLTGEPE